jgi:hypothetical protein
MPIGLSEHYRRSEVMYSFPLLLVDGEGAPATFAAVGPCVSAVNEVERPARRVAHMFDGPFKRAWNGPSLWAKRTRG